MGKKELDRQRRRRVTTRNRQIIDQWKLDRKICCDCPRRVTPETLHHFDVDHVDPNEKRYAQLRDISNLATLLAELDKCVLRCAICHRDRCKRLKHHFHRNPVKPYEPTIEWAQLFEWPA